MGIIKNITIDNAQYCFGDAPAKIKDLGKVNFIFAANASGKTTISRKLAKQPTDIDGRKTWEVAKTTYPIRVFDEDYKN